LNCNNNVKEEGGLGKGVPMYILHENTLGLLDPKLSLAENTCGLGMDVDK